MKKRLLLMLAATLGVSSGVFAADYNDGDYIQTMNGGFLVSGSNLITNGLGDFTTYAGTPVLENDTFTVSNDGPDGSQCITVSKGGSAAMSSESSYLTKTPTLFYSMPVDANQRYVVTYKVKGYLEANSASIIMPDGRVRQFHGIYLNTLGGIGRDATTDGYVDVAKHVEYGDGWTEFSYDFLSESSAFINILFAQLLGNDSFCDFGIYKVTKVADQRNIKDMVDRLSFYKDETLFPEGQNLVTEFSDLYSSMIGDYESADESSISDDLKDLEAEFLDANSVDVSSYFTNFGFEQKTISTKGGAAPGWTSSEGADRWGVAAATGNFTSNHVTDDIGANYDLTAASYYQTVNLPAGKYLYGVQVQWYRYLYKGGSSSWNTDYYMANPGGIKFFVNNDSVTIDSIPTFRGRLVQHVFEVKEDGDVTIGFYTPGTTDSQGGHLMFDNILIRRIGTESVEDYYYKGKVDEAKNALKVMLDSAKVVITKDQYIFGRTVLQDSINVADARYALEYASSQESVDLLTAYMTQIRQAIRDYYTINAEYTTLYEDVAKAKVLTTDEKRTKDMDVFKAAVATAEAYLTSITAEVRDSAGIMAADEALLAAQQTWYITNAALETPAYLTIVNPSFKSNGSGWNTSDGTSGNAIWKYSDDALFEDGRCAYYNRGYTAADAKHIYQDVTIENAGVYAFAAQCIANSSAWTMTGGEDAWSDFNTYTYLYANTDSTYVITQGISQKSSSVYGPGTDVRWFSATTKVADLSALEAGANTLRVGLQKRSTEASQGVSANNIRIGSCRLYYYGSIEDYETGIVTVKDITNSTLNGAVYNLSGVKVGNSLTGLAKGIYIMNGKKYVVK